MIDLTTFREYVGDTPVIFTHHAIDRLKESKLDTIEGKKLLYDAVQLPVHNVKSKYSANKNTRSFWMNGTIKYTVIPEKHKQHGYDIFLVLTVTDSRVVTRYMGFR